MRARTREALEDMLESARKAMHYHADKRKGWREEDLRVDAILRRVGVLGEAAARVPFAERQLWPSVAWKEIIGMRQHIVHGYDRIDFDILEQVLTSHLPTLEAELQRLLVEDAGAA